MASFNGQTAESMRVGSDLSNLFSIDSSGVVTLTGTSKRHLSVRPQTSYSSIIGQGKPTAVSLGAYTGFSLPVYNSDSEELFFKVSSVPGRWDGASDIVFSARCALAGAEDVGDKFQLQLSWANKACTSGVISSSTTDVPVETTVLADRAAQYSVYNVEFTIDWDGPNPDIAVGDELAFRLRQIAASGSQVSNEIIVCSVLVTYQVDKMFKV